MSTTAGAEGGGEAEGRGAVPPQTTLPDLVAERSVVVCCGSGGVGKTTVSATFALAAARAGRRSCVVTVDPARRLADALGVESLPNTPSEVEGDWPGHLHALMLDSKGTFDDLVQRYARTPEQAEAILTNRLYQNLAGALSGTQEYMAMEKLYELVHSEEFDIVVVDTPPTRNALDLLDAPRRLTRFLENRLFRALLVPTRMSLRAVGVATQALLKHDLQGGRCRDRAGRGRLLPGLRRDGGRVPEPGQCRPRPPGRPGDGLRPRHLGPPRRRRPRPASSPRSWPSARSPWPPWSSTASRRPSETVDGAVRRGQRRRARHAGGQPGGAQRAGGPGGAGVRAGWRRRWRRPRSAGSRSSARTCTRCSGCSGPPTQLFS